MLDTPLIGNTMETVDSPALYNWGLELASRLALGDTVATALAYIPVLLVILLASVAAYYLARLLLLYVLAFLLRRLHGELYRRIKARRVLQRISHLAPAAVIYLGVSALLPPTHTTVVGLVQVCTLVYMVIASLVAVNAAINALHDVYLTLEVARTRVIKPYVQVVQTVLYVLGSILVVSIVIHRNPVNLFLGLGAMAAVLMLIFKDAILGLVASIQASVNNLVKPGDWVVVPSRNADGTVLEITLTIVKVQNWDRTIVTFPTYALVSESLQNWKGMSESNGRRIKTPLYIDVRSVHACSPEEVARFQQVMLLADYIAEEKKVLERQNAAVEHLALPGINSVRFTNLGMFRNYANRYLKSHPLLDHGDTCMARLLPATDKGIPLEIYCFSRITEWEAYEGVQGDIVEHLLSVAPEFGLRIYQHLSGADVRPNLPGAEPSA